MTGHLLVKLHLASALSLARRGSKGEVGKDYFTDKVNQYIHHIWTLKNSAKGGSASGGKTMEFSDLRKFGKIVLDNTKKISELKEVKALGVDAMSLEFTLKKFEEILNRKNNKPLGLVLMEQELIAGIGNIYRSEILFEAGILPTRLVKNIKSPEIKKLYLAIQKVLRKAIKLRGTSDSDYRDTAGAPGSFQKALKVYKRSGKKCLKCGKIILRGKMGQRSVFHCSRCQK